jgi:HEAT repeat protein
MRYWIMSLALVLFAVAHGASQDTKKKDAGGKDGKDGKAQQKEPTEYLGKSFDQWREDLNYKKQADPSKRETAMKAVLMFSLPKAGEAMHDIVADLKRHPKITVDMSVRVNGLMALNTYFLHMASAKKTPDKDFLKDAMDIYRRSLKDSQIIVRERAVQGLKYLGPQARDLLDDVIPLAKDSSTWELRKEAIPIMVMLAAKEKGPGDAKALIALKYLADPTKENSYVVRALAVTGLGIVGHETTMVELKRALGDKSKEVRVAAVQAMVYGKEGAMLDLKRTFEDPSQPKEVRLTAITAYGAAGGENALEGLRKVLDYDDKEFRMQALNTMIQLAKFIKTAPKDLTFKKLEDRARIEKEPYLIIMTNYTMMNALNEVDKTHMSPILQQLHHKDVQIRLAALRVISMGATKSKLICYQPVLDLIEDPDTHVAVAAMETLVHMHAWESIPKLKSIIKQQDDLIRANDPKARVELHDGAETALEHFEMQKMKKDNEKKTSEKK